MRRDSIFYKLFQTYPPLLFELLTNPPENAQAPQEARYLLQRTQQERPEQLKQGIIELITTIVMYKFEQMSQKEVQEMLGELRFLNHAESFILLDSISR